MWRSTAWLALCLLPYQGHAIRSDRGSASGVAAFLKSEAQRIGSAELMQIAQQAKGPDAMENVKKLISHMIAQHMASQAEDTTHKAFCDKEMSGSKTKVEKLNTEIEKKSADRDLLSAKLAELKDNIGDLHEEVAKAHKDRAKATEIRQKESAEYEKVKADLEATEHATARAATGLDSEEHRQSVEEVEKRTIDKRVHAEGEEDDRAFKFKQLDGELQEAVAVKTKEAEQKEHEVVRMKHDLVIAEGDTKSLQEELDASVEYSEKIKHSCVAQAEPHEERKRRREEEIGSLKEAYGMLNGDVLPVML